MTNDPCQHALEHLYLYLDGELDDVTHTELRSHLEKCAICTGAFDFETQFKQLIREKLMEDVTDDMMARLKAAIQEGGRERRRFAGRRRSR